MHHLADTRIRVIDLNKDFVILLKDDQTETLTDTPLTESEFLLEPAHNIYCKTTTLQINCRGSESFLER